MWTKAQIGQWPPTLPRRAPGAQGQRRGGVRPPAAAAGRRGLQSRQRRNAPPSTDSLPGRDVSQLENAPRGARNAQRGTGSPRPSRSTGQTTSSPRDSNGQPQDPTRRQQSAAPAPRVDVPPSVSLLSVQHLPRSPDEVRVEEASGATTLPCLPSHQTSAAAVLKNAHSTRGPGTPCATGLYAV